MKMRHKTAYAAAAVILAALLSSCSAQSNIYDADEYVMFSDTLMTYPVRSSEDYFRVPVVSTVTRPYDRNIGVEVIDSECTAIETLHFSIASNTVTIAAGQTRADLPIKGNFDELSPNSDVELTLELVMPESLDMPGYSRRTKVRMFKSCPLDINSFTGWCVLSSTFLQTYNPYGSYQRLVRTELSDKENTIICRNWMLKGYDIELSFDTSDTLSPTVTVPAGQTMSDEGSFFGQTHGDDRILVGPSSYAPSYYYPCGNYLYVWTRMYVKDLNSTIGTVGHFYTVMEWISDEEARRLHYSGMAGEYYE